MDSKDFSIYTYKSPKLASGISTSGKRSYIRAENKGRSSARNLGMFESLIALISTTFSDRVLFALFKVPAITSTDFTALIPKS